MRFSLSCDHKCQDGLPEVLNIDLVLEFLTKCSSQP